MIQRRTNQSRHAVATRHTPAYVSVLAKHEHRVLWKYQNFSSNLWAPRDSEISMQVWFLLHHTPSDTPPLVFIQAGWLAPKALSSIAPHIQPNLDFAFRLLLCRFLCRQLAQDRHPKDLHGVDPQDAVLRRYSGRKYHTEAVQQREQGWSRARGERGVGQIGSLVLLSSPEEDTPLYLY